VRALWVLSWIKVAPAGFEALRVSEKQPGMAAVGEDKGVAYYYFHFFVNCFSGFCCYQGTALPGHLI